MSINVSRIKEVSKSFSIESISFKQQVWIRFNTDKSRFIFNQVKAMHEHDRNLIKGLTNSLKVNYYLNRINANMYLNELKKIYSFLYKIDSIVGKKAYEGLIRGFIYQEVKNVVL
ncbi:MAG: hypothetical protein LBC39_06685 [Methanobrevibacter sp.]|nr:hypothetical protein [Candidatus Methanovirga aequatorialis]